MSMPASSAPAAYIAHLPGEDGWPIVGNTLAALKDPVGRVETMYRKYGPVYRDHLFGVRSVTMLGPEGHLPPLRCCPLPCSAQTMANAPSGRPRGETPVRARAGASGIRSHHQAGGR